MSNLIESGFARKAAGEPDASGRNRQRDDVDDTLRGHAEKGLKTAGRHEFGIAVGDTRIEMRQPLHGPIEACEHTRRENALAVVAIGFAPPGTAKREDAGQRRERHRLLSSHLPRHWRASASG
jgi:hypothetical protein